MRLRCEPQKRPVAFRCFIDTSELLTVESGQRRYAYFDTVLLYLACPTPDDAAVDHDRRAENSVARLSVRGVSRVEHRRAIGIPDGVTALGGTALADFGAKVREDIDSTGRYGDAGTADLLTGISRDVDKHLWLLEAHLQAGR